MRSLKGLYPRLHASQPRFRIPLPHQDPQLDGMCSESTSTSDRVPVNANAIANAIAVADQARVFGVEASLMDQVLHIIAKDETEEESEAKVSFLRMLGIADDDRFTLDAASNLFAVDPIVETLYRCAQTVVFFPSTDKLRDLLDWIGVDNKKREVIFKATGEFSQRDLTRWPRDLRYLTHPFRRRPGFAECQMQAIVLRLLEDEAPHIVHCPAQNLNKYRHYIATKEGQYCLLDDSIECGFNTTKPLPDFGRGSTQGLARNLPNPFLFCCDAAIKIISLCEEEGSTFLDTINQDVEIAVHLLLRLVEALLWLPEGVSDTIFDWKPTATIETPSSATALKVR